MSSLQPVLEQIEKDSQQALDRLFEFLRIESISTDPAYATQCADAADWLVKDLQSFGVNASRHDTPGHPMVTGHTGVGGDSGSAAAKVLFYGHYDVQPVDPLELWNNPPFSPLLEDTAHGKVIRARGAADDKGQLMTFVEACRAWHKVHGTLPADITFLFEGEEESGSPSLVPFLKQHADQLRADLALVCDTGMWNADTPAICTMLRGMLGEEITITAADKDLHSGMYGGAAQNPIKILTHILAGLHDDQGRVTIPGFYDGVDPLPTQIAEQWNSLGFNADEFLSEVNLSVVAGEKDYSALEQLWSRPTCEMNGITGGYTGDGFKTVLPSKASAKVSFRLVGDQDPHAIRKNFREYVQQQLPADCTVEFEEHGASPGIVLPLDNPAFEKSRLALSDEWEGEAVYTGCGGSIPIVGYFREYLGMDSLMIGFGLDDDQIHSPNEKYSLKSFQKGIRSWARVLDSLAG
jgi:acetylornithine deacetylase/succinyl-diaminopimelate desuccinylase-like protein